MGLETGTYIDSLVATNPTSGDVKSEGDDHLRLIKSTIKATFAGVTGAVTPTHTELNFVDGVTSAIQTQMDLKAPLASPTLTGTPVAPTAAVDTNTTQVATTAFVTAAFIAGAYPTVSGNSGKFLTNDGTDTSWGDVYTETEVDALISALTITTDTTFYLRDDGSDSNDGSANTSGSAWLTLGKAFTYLSNLNISNDVTITLSLAANASTGWDALSAVTIDTPNAGQIEIVGSGSANTILTFTGDGITVTGTTLLEISALELYGPTDTSSHGIEIEKGCIELVDDCEITNFYMGVHARYQSTILLTNCTIVGVGTGYCVYLIYNSTARVSGGSANTASQGYAAIQSSHISITDSTTIGAGVANGAYASYNSFVDATGVATNSATTPCFPTATTSDTTPTWGNYGSWILDV